MYKFILYFFLPGLSNRTNLRHTKSALSNLRPPSFPVNSWKVSDLREIMSSKQFQTYD